MATAILEFKNAALQSKVIGIPREGKAPGMPDGAAE